MRHRKDRRYTTCYLTGLRADRQGLLYNKMNDHHNRENLQKQSYSRATFLSSYSGFRVLTIKNPCVHRDQTHKFGRKLPDVALNFGHRETQSLL